MDSKPHYLTLTDWSLCTKAVVNSVSINLRPSAEYLLIFSKSDSLMNPPKPKQMLTRFDSKMEMNFYCDTPILKYLSNIGDGLLDPFENPAG